MNCRLTSILAILILFSLNGSVWAKVGSNEALQLGQELTPTGAVRAGNKAGTIPRWNGGITSPIAGYEKGMFHPDPFAKDKIKFKIDANNWQEHQANLTQGQITLLKKFPTFNINVYPSHRSAAYPQFVYDALKKMP